MNFDARDAYIKHTPNIGRDVTVKDLAISDIGKMITIDSENWAVTGRLTKIETGTNEFTLPSCPEIYERHTLTLAGVGPVNVKPDTRIIIHSEEEVND